jgi:hypothetical protein
MEKKPYTPPTVSNLGSIVVETKGFGGVQYEFSGRSSVLPGNKRPTKE